VTPSHRDGLAAARRVNAANADGCPADVSDVLMMMVYHTSLVIRDLPESQRVAKALEVSRQLVANVRESLD